MHELGWFTCPSAFGATPRPAPAYPCAHSCIFGPCGSHYESLKKGRMKLGPATGRPTTADSVVALLYSYQCTGSPWHSLCPVLPVSLRAPSSSALFALVSLQVHKKKKKKISLFCILICISFAFRVYLLLFTRTCLWWYYYPARTVLWCVIAHKNDFVECYHPQEWFLWEATMPHKDY
mgnify:CR=1 FL=1